MRLAKIVALALLLTLGHLFVLKACIAWQSYPHLFWPSLVLRLLLLVIAAPPLGLEGLAALKWGIHLYRPGIFLAYYLLLFFLGSKLKNLWDAISSEPVKARRMLFAGTGVMTLGALGLAKVARDLTVVHHTLPLKELPPELANLKIVLLADLHRGPAVSQAYLLEVIELVNAQQPDIVLMPGDFVSKSKRYYPDLTEALAKLNPSVGTFATLGNHDHWEGAEEALEALAKAGVVHLQNRHLYLTPDRQIVDRAKRGLCLAGVDDYWCGSPDSEHLKDVTSNNPVILLSHNPDVCEVEKTQQHRVDFQVSGHTHGGQVVLPGLGPVATASGFGTKYLYGWNEGPNWPVYTTSGIGTSTVPVRLGTKPELVVFTLETT
jgi:predicted MPP superfamily phosphohydrolase